MNALEVLSLHAGYGAIAVLRGIDVAVPEGTLVAVVGANGAGKSTLLKCVSGLLRPSAGEIRVAGRRVDSHAPSAIVRLGVAHVPERRQIFAEMSVADNLHLGAYAARMDRRALARRVDEVIELFPALRERLTDDASALSGGQQQMLAIARGLMLRPRLLMLDEPSLGLAPRLVSEIFDVLAALRAGGTSVLLVEQNARASLAIADHAYVLETGRVAAEGAGRELLADERVTARYLGTAGARPDASRRERARSLAEQIRGRLAPP